MMGKNLIQSIFVEIDLIQPQFINIQAYSIIQFNQIMLTLIFPKFYHNTFHAYFRLNDTIVGFYD